MAQVAQVGDGVLRGQIPLHKEAQVGVIGQRLDIALGHGAVAQQQHVLLVEAPLAELAQTQPQHQPLAAEGEEHQYEVEHKGQTGEVELFDEEEDGLEHHEVDGAGPEQPPHLPVQTLGAQRVVEVHGPQGDEKDGEHAQGEDEVIAQGDAPVVKGEEEEPGPIGDGHAQENEEGV